MPPPKKGSAQAQKGKYADVIFVNWALTAAQKKELKAAPLDLEWLDTQYIRLSDEGYKISVQQDEFNDCYSCFITQRKKDGPNFGMILTGRGSTPAKAAKQAIYIGFHLMEGDFAKYSTEQKGEEIDD